MVAGWVGISGTVQLTTQTQWLALGIGSLILAGFAMVGWLVAGTVRITALRRGVVAELNARSIAAEATAAGTPTTSTTSTSEMYGVAPGMRRYHRPDCRLLIDKRATFDSSAVHAAAGRTPCGICAAPARATAAT
jgi:hypothetical protein